MPGPVAAFWIAVEVINELAGSLHIARGDELLAEPVRWLALVGESQCMPDGLAGNAVAAALVAEQVAPAARPRHSAARIAAPGDRSGAGDVRTEERLALPAKTSAILFCVTTHRVGFRTADVETNDLHGVPSVSVGGQRADAPAAILSDCSVVAATLVVGHLPPFSQ